MRLQCTNGEKLHCARCLEMLGGFASDSLGELASSCWNMARHTPLRQRFEREQRRRTRLPNFFKQVWNACVFVFWVLVIVAAHWFVWQWLFGLVG